MANNEAHKIIQALQDARSGTRGQPEEQLTNISRLKILGRVAAPDSPIFKKDTIEILSWYGYCCENPQIYRESLRCLANALLLGPTTRPIFVQLGNAPWTATRLKGTSPDDDFLSARILLCMYYEPTFPLNELVDDLKLAAKLSYSIIEHSTSYIQSDRGQASQSELPFNMIIDELLRLLFNIAAKRPDSSDTFQTCVMPMFQVLRYEVIDKANLSLDVPNKAIINAIACLNIDDSLSSELFPEPDECRNTDTVLNLLDSVLAHQEFKDASAELVPLLTVLRTLYALAPVSVQQTLQKKLLPSDKERDLPLGRSNELCSRLLRLSTEQHDPALTESIIGLMFQLSESNPGKLVANIGYGHASGFLMNHGMAIPSPGSGNDEPQDINPITGQYLNKEGEVTLPPMTDEEKEREAERLFVLFERLKQTGVVDVQNPVEAALQSGRFEELDPD